MSSISFNGAAISGLLSGISGGGASGMFAAISGGGQSTNQATATLQSLAGGGTGSAKDIGSLTRQQKTDQARNRMYSEAALRMSYMQQGRYDPVADWEKVASYAMQTGQPVTVSLNSQGRLEAVTQADSDLSRFSVAQQKQLSQAFSDLQEVAGKIKANKTNDTWVQTLEGANTVLNGIASGALSAQSDWERTGSSLLATGTPFKIALDDKGQITIKEQSLELAPDLPIESQLKLRDAAQGLSQTLSSGLVTEVWEADAKSMFEAGVGFYLDIDPVTQEISAKENSGTNIVPKFLRDPPYPDIGADTKWKQTAASLIQDGKPFFLDFDQGGHITAKEATAANLIQYNKPVNQIGSLGNGAVLSLLA